MAQMQSAVQLLLLLLLLLAATAAASVQHRTDQRGGQPHRRRALVSLLVDASQHGPYNEGAVALIKSSLRHAPGYFDAHLLLLLNNRTYEPAVLEQARVAGWRLRWVDPVVPPHPSTFARFRDQFAKLHLWALDEFFEVVYMDLDAVFVGPLRGHFTSLAAYLGACRIWAARDIRGSTWQDGFNMGVAAIRPDASEHARLLALLASDSVSYEHVMSEQGWLNAVYTSASGSWCELPMELNANLAAFTADRARWDAAAPQMAVIHFTLHKPWAADCAGAFAEPCARWAAERHSAAAPVTAVTAYFAGRNKHGAAKYTQWAANFMAQRHVPLVVMTDEPAALPASVAARPANVTRIIKVDRASLLVASSTWDWDKQLGRDQERSIHSTHLFKVWLSKPELVLRAAAANPFNSSLFVWVDFGCFRSASAWPGGSWTVHAERLPPDERMLVMDTPSGSWPGGKSIAGTIYGGSVRSWRLYSAHYYALAAREHRRGGFVGDDQVVMSLLAERQPGLTCRITPPAGDAYGDPWFFLQHYLAGTAPAQQACGTAAAASSSSATDVVPGAAADEVQT